VAGSWKENAARMGIADIVAAVCAPSASGGLGLASYAGLFLAGLGSGVVHCAPMCGPFVLGQVSDALSGPPALCQVHQRTQALLLPYHAGRLTTYAVLGAIAGGLTAGLGQAFWPAGLRGALLGLAALLFLGLALRRLAPSFAARLPHPRLVSGRLGPILARLTARTNGAHQSGRYLRGLLLGFLPCGTLYTALLVAAAASSPLAGAGALLAFGLGTVPALLAVGLAGHVAARSWGQAIAAASPAILILNAAILAVLAWNAS